MKKLVCLGLLSALLALGAGVNEASAAVVRFRGFVAGPVVRPVPRVVVAPRPLMAPPVYVAPRPMYAVPRPLYLPPPVVVPAPPVVCW